MTAFSFKAHQPSVNHWGGASGPRRGSESESCALVRGGGGGLLGNRACAQGRRKEKCVQKTDIKRKAILWVKQELSESGLGDRASALNGKMGSGTTGKFCNPSQQSPASAGTCSSAHIALPAPFSLPPAPPSCRGPQRPGPPPVFLPHQLGRRLAPADSPFLLAPRGQVPGLQTANLATVLPGVRGKHLVSAPNSGTEARPGYWGRSRATGEAAGQEKGGGDIAGSLTSHHSCRGATHRRAQGPAVR